MPERFLAGVVKQPGPSLMLLMNLTKMKYQTLFPKLKYVNSWEFLSGPVVKTWCFYWDLGWIPGQGTKILQATQHSQKKKKVNSLELLVNFFSQGLRHGDF